MPLMLESDGRWQWRCRRFLAAMLEGVEAEVNLAGGVGVAMDGNHAALFS